VANLQFEEADGTTAYQYFWIEIEKSVAGEDVYLQMSEWGLGTYSGLEKYQEEQANKETGTDEPIKYNVLDGTKLTGGESLPLLFDGDSSTKWGNSLTNRQEGETSNGAFFIVKASRSIAPSYYALTTANDTQSYPGRNWKQWQIYGMNADSDAAVTRDAEGWVPLDKKYNVGTDQLPATNFTQVFFSLSEGDVKAYRYFKLELDQIVSSGDYMQMAEFALGDEYTLALDAAALAEKAAKEYDPDLFAPKALLDEFAELIETIKNCSEPSQLAVFSSSVDAKIAEINAGAANYSELISARNQAINAIDGGNLKESAVTYLTTWISETDAVAPNTEYPCGNIAYIKANRQLSSDEARAEANRISAFIINNAAIVDGPINPDLYTDFYTAIAGSGGFGGEEHAMLYDGDRDGTKWCTNTLPAWTVFKVSDDYDPIKPTYYGLVTGGDTHSYPGRNWKTWKIWAANDLDADGLVLDPEDENYDASAIRNSGKWVLIDEKTNIGSDILHTENKFESYINLSIGCKESYRYFMIEVTAAGSGDLIQMNEFTFYNQGNLQDYRQTFIDEFADYKPEDMKPAYIGYINDYNAKYQELCNTVNAPDLMKIKNELTDLQAKIEKSNELYITYDDIYAELEGLSISSENLGAWHTGYTSESIAPCAKYVRGTYAYIMDNLNLDDDAITAETTYLQRIVDAVNGDLYILLDGHTQGEWGDGFYGNLIDGIALNEEGVDGEGNPTTIKATKWGGQASEAGDTYIIFRTYDPVNPFFYTLTTGNDTSRFPGRNWGTWYIYGGNFEGDGAATKDAEGWVLVDERVNVGQDRLHPVDAQPSYFGFSTETTVPYTYYKVVVTKAYEGNAIQMNELHFGTAEEFEVLKNEFKDAANDFASDVIAQQALIDKYVAAIPEIDDCMNMEALFRANYVLETLRDSITASAALYSELQNKVEEISSYIEDNPLEGSDALSKLVTYMTVKEGVSETYPNGTFEYIYDNHVLADSVVAAEIEFLQAMKVAAIAAGYGPGMDITDMIVNRSFADAKQVVDADGKNVTGTKQATGWTGYLYSNGTNAEGTMSAAEFCNEQSKFNISQTLKGLKNGYYQVKLNAGFRPHNDIHCFDYAALAYANDTKTFVPVVREAMETEKENAWTGSIADKEIYAVDLLGPNEDPSGDPAVDSLVVGYVIWGVQGTINAILHDRYEITMVAQVADGNLTFGLKNDGTVVGSDWLGAGNFRLTYLGENASAEAIATAATYNGARAATLTETYVSGDPYAVDEFKAAPNFGAAQKEALAKVASSSTVDQLVADGNLFADISATKAAYYNLCYYNDIVYKKWGNHDFDGSVENDIYDVSDKLSIGTYENVSAANAALEELLAKYPDYLDINAESSNSISNATFAEVEGDAFNFEIVPASDKRVAVYFSTMYDDLTDKETLLEFEYTSEEEIDNVEIQNFTGDMTLKVPVTLEATSEFKKISLDVKELGFKKASDVVLFRFTPKNGAKINIRHMLFVETEGGDKGDLNGDGYVDTGDIQLVLNDMADDKYDASKDLNGDGYVDTGDIQIILNIMAEQ
jgi:hypothetical protein